MAMDDLIDSCIELLMTPSSETTSTSGARNGTCSRGRKLIPRVMIAPSCIMVPKGGKRSVSRANGRESRRSERSELM